MEQNELITSMLNKVQHLMNTTYVFPEDKIDLLRWDEEHKCVVFPEGYPKNDGSYLEVLTHTAKQVFNDGYVHHGGMLYTSEVENNFLVTVHLMSIVDIENVYDIHVQTKVYKPQGHTPVVVSCQLIGYTACAIEDCREYLRYLMNQKTIMESGIESSRQAYAEMQSTIDKFRSLTAALSDIHLNMEARIRLIQRDVRNLPEEMRTYTRRLAEYNNRLYDVLQRMNDL
nr:MAG TPA: hypothetical protein [Bacteriophage sp.]